MTPFVLALIPSVFYAIANHVDKYLISNYVKHGEVGALIIFSAIFGVVTLPIIYAIEPGAISVGFLPGIILILNDMLIVISMLLYFYALHEDETSVIIPFYQTIPIFALILGFFFLGEVITSQQGLAALLIIAGALILSIQLSEGVPTFRRKVVIYMIGASLLYAVNGVIFKYVALDYGFWTSVFWGFIGKAVLGVLFLIFITSYRRQFFTMIRENTVAAFGLNSLSETLFILGECILNFAILLAPVGLILLGNSFQPLFVLIIGVLLTLLYPSIAKESIMRNDLIQKIAGIVLLGLGAYFVGI